eukprot:3179-Heterococcus_DN1.PRE.6
MAAALGQVNTYTHTETDVCAHVCTYTPPLHTYSLMCSLAARQRRATVLIHNCLYWQQHHTCATHMLSAL